MAINNKIFKRCPKCGEDKELTEEFWGQITSKKKGWSCWRCYCRSCHNQSTAQWRKKNPDRQKELTQKWAKANPERIRELGKKWAKNNPVAVVAKSRRWQKKNPEKVRLLWNRAGKVKIDSLSDSYVVRCLRHMNAHHGGRITPEMIVIKRELLQYDRITKELNNVINR